MTWIVLTYLISICIAIFIVPIETTLVTGIMFMFLGVLVYSLLNYSILLIKEFVLKENLRLYQQIMDSFEEDDSVESESKTE